MKSIKSVKLLTIATCGLLTAGWASATLAFGDGPLKAPCPFVLENKTSTSMKYAFIDHSSTDVSTSDIKTLKAGEPLTEYSDPMRVHKPYLAVLDKNATGSDTKPLAILYTSYCHVPQQPGPPGQMLPVNLSSHGASAHTLAFGGELKPLPGHHAATPMTATIEKDGDWFKFTPHGSDIHSSDAFGWIQIMAPKVEAVDFKSPQDVKALNSHLQGSKSRAIQMKDATLEIETFSSNPTKSGATKVDIEPAQDNIKGSLILTEQVKYDEKLSGPGMSVYKGKACPRLGLRFYNPSSQHCKTIYATVKVKVSPQ